MGITKAAHQANMSLAQYVNLQERNAKLNEPRTRRIFPPENWQLEYYPSENEEFESIGFDYISFFCPTTKIQELFVDLIESYFEQPIPIHCIDPYGKVVPSIANKKGIYIIKQTQGSRNYINFPGEGSRLIFQIIFEQEIIDFCKTKKITLRRIDFQTTSALKPMNNSEISHLYDEFNSKQGSYELKAAYPRKIEYTRTPEVGLIVYIYPIQISYRIRVYSWMPPPKETMPTSVRCEVELRTQKLKKANEFWLLRDKESFHLELLNTYLGYTSNLVKCNLLSGFHDNGKVFLKNWINNLSPASNSTSTSDSDSNRLRNLPLLTSLVRPYDEDSEKNEDKKIQEDSQYLIEHSAVYPAYLALFYTAFDIVQEEQIRRKTGLFKEPLQLSFSLSELIENLGLKNTRSQQRTMKKSLISLEKISHVIQTKNKRDFSRLISSSSVKGNKVTLAINVDIFMTLLSSVKINEEFYARFIRAYNKKFKGVDVDGTNTTRSPDYIWPLRLQAQASLTSNVIYSGKVPKNANAKKAFTAFLEWILFVEFVDQNLIKEKEIQLNSEKGKKIYSFREGSLQINTN